MQVLLYADDIVILCDNPIDLQRALDAANAWTEAWRLHFSVGLTKSAVMVFGRGRVAIPPFHVGTHVLPCVYQYTYLEVTIDARLSWTHHVSELLRRGEHKMATCLSWTRSADLPICFVERIFQTYVRPSVCFGMEFVDPGPQIRRFQTKLLQWGRRLLLWPRSGPGVVVPGQLGWQDASTLRLQQAASLWARLLSLPANCSAAHTVRYAASQPNSWVHLLVSQLSSVGVPRPHTCGIHMGCASSQLERWLRQLRRILSDWSKCWHSAKHGVPTFICTLAAHA